MSQYTSLSKPELERLKDALQASYQEQKELGLTLNMARGKPCKEQLDLSMDMLNLLNGTSDLVLSTGDDCRNYGILEGIPEMRRLFADLMDADPADVIVSGNSSLTLMFDLIASAMSDGIDGGKPWSQQGKLKFLCPVPGYDRHFSITEYYDMEMILVPMTSTGPDMDLWCRWWSPIRRLREFGACPSIPNPQGITYSRNRSPNGRPEAGRPGFPGVLGQCVLCA